MLQRTIKYIAQLAMLMFAAGCTQFGSMPIYGSGPIIGPDLTPYTGVYRMGPDKYGQYATLIVRPFEDGTSVVKSLSWSMNDAKDAYVGRFYLSKIPGSKFHLVTVPGEGYETRKTNPYRYEAVLDSGKNTAAVALVDNRGLHFWDLYSQDLQSNLDGFKDFGLEKNYLLSYVRTHLDRITSKNFVTFTRTPLSDIDSNELSELVKDYAYPYECSPPFTGYFGSPEASIAITSSWSKARLRKNPSATSTAYSDCIKNGRFLLVATSIYRNASHFASTLFDNSGSLVERRWLKLR